MVLRLEYGRRPRGARRPLREAVKDFLWGDHVRHVVDVRLGTFVGAVIEHGRRSPRTGRQLVDPYGRRVAAVTSGGGHHHVVDTTGALVGRMWRTAIRRGSDLNVDVSMLADRVDPRLILACALMIS